MARASIAAQRRRARSSSTGSRLVYFVLMVWTVTFRMQTILPIEGENWISYSGETPYLREGGRGGRPLRLRVRHRSAQGGRPQWRQPSRPAQGRAVAPAVGAAGRRSFGEGQATPGAESDR